MHHGCVRESDGYCWWGAHYVPAAEWEYRDRQMSLLAEQKNKQMVVV